jgi:XTP/dITP diphosphohydrolase
MSTRPALPDRVLVLATRNEHKLAELRRILAPVAVGVQVVDLSGFADLPAVRETGLTFEANAELKATAVAAHTGLPAVADDSGICVDVMAGMPGTLSARWAGRQGDDAANLRLLLDQLADVPADSRGAWFECSAVLALPNGRTQVTAGRIDGALTFEPRGTGGFGYDPIFVPNGERRTLAEMTDEEKDEISHRGRAFRRLAPLLSALV